MSIYQMNNPLKVKHLFINWNETMIWSYLDGCMGKCYVDDLQNPQSAQIMIADFCFFAGVVHRELVSHMPCNFMIAVPQNKEWEKMIKNVYGEKATFRLRYATLKEKDIFDKQFLIDLVRQLPEGYTLQRIDENIYDEIFSSLWQESHDLCSQFDKQEFLEHGIGFVIKYQGDIIAGASTYTYYRGGIEIEIDTRSDYRHKGFATICASKLILACLDRNIYPSWDAHNPISLKLAEKLGYHFDRKYNVYEIIR